jgi:cytochrome P450 family 9
LTVDRCCTKDFEADLGNGKTVTIKKGEVVWIPIYSIHHDSEIYPDPEKFDPSRFSDENKNKIKPCTYLPFGSGPRNCIGTRFALMEAKLLLFHILSKFTIEVCDKTPSKLTLTATVLIDFVEKLFVEFKLRK